jgi:hypothetical protein
LSRSPAPRRARQGDTSLTIGSARVEPSVRRAASLGNDGATAVRAVPRLDLHPAVAAEEGSERIPRAMRPSLCGHGAVTLLAVHDTAHLRGHRVPAYRANSGSRRSGCRPREPVQPCARLLRAVGPAARVAHALFVRAYPGWLRGLPHRRKEESRPWLGGAARGSRPPPAGSAASDVSRNRGRGRSRSCRSAREA